MEDQQPLDLHLYPPVFLSDATLRLRAVLAGESKPRHLVEHRSVRFADPPGLSKGSVTEIHGTERREIVGYTHALLPGREFPSARAVLDALEDLT